MKYLKLFESYSISKDEYPFNGHSLSSREEKILKDLVGDYYLDFRIKKEDGYYYTYKGIIYYNRFDNFNDLKDYIQFIFFKNQNEPNKILELLKTTNLDMSFDNNSVIRLASQRGHLEIVKLLLNNPRVDPSDCNNWSIKWASENGHIEIVKLLLEDPRVDPSVDNNYALRKASRNGHREIFKLLSKDPRVHNSLHLW